MSIASAIDRYLQKHNENWRSWIPDSVRALAGAQHIGMPQWRVEDISDPRNRIQMLDLALRVPAAMGVIPPQGYEFKAHREFEFKLLDKSTDPIRHLGIMMTQILEEYKAWAVGFYLDCPSGCLIVWEDEHLESQSAKAHNLLKGEGAVRPQLGVMLMEDEDGAVSVQLFQDTKKAVESFDQLSGAPGDKPQRATLLTLNYDGDVVDAAAKMLPETVDKTKGPDMHVLGTGPVKFKEGWKAEVKESFKEFTQGAKS